MPLLHYHQHQLHYEQYGQGPKLLFCLHGIAGRGKLFEQVTKPMWEDYTILSLDLPFHGDTVWEAELYDDVQIAEILQLLMQQQGQRQYSIMVHSMGGRVLLGILPHLAHQIQRLYLFSPGGFQYVFTGSRIWWPLAARRWVRRRFEEPEGFVKILDAVAKLKLFERDFYLMLLQQVNTVARRKRLLRSWASLYYFDMRVTKKHRALLEQYQIPIHFFYGDRDSITPVRHARQFMKKYPNATLEIVSGDHFFVKEDLVVPFKVWYEQQNFE